MLRVGLTGGIGSGKSTVSARLREHGAVVIDYDVLAREAVEVGSPALARIRERFGDDVIADDGSLDRPALGALVFSDDAARRDLEAITHPAIRDLARAREEQAIGADVVLHDHPLLVEMGMAQGCDVVVVVDVPPEVQVERLVRDRGMSEDEARARLAAQADRDDRRAAADVVLDNSGSVADLESAVDRLWSDLLARVHA
ncbi:dephospho-CoA kinase [Aeromicrobium halocynthiae]|uniref:Dephospho-CoA kinase n=1 Tax=Aeromicrobium halocynthiae TaxID=560557 RepID=A0ABN2VS43_9ACTN